MMRRGSKTLSVGDFGIKNSTIMLGKETVFSNLKGLRFSKRRFHLISSIHVYIK